MDVKYLKDLAGYKYDILFQTKSIEEVELAINWFKENVNINDYKQIGGTHPHEISFLLKYDEDFNLMRLSLHGIKFMTFIRYV